MVDEPKPSEPPSAGPSPAARKLSPLEQIRAKAAKAAEGAPSESSPAAPPPASSEAGATAAPAPAGKPMSRLEAIRAAAAAKKAGGAKAESPAAEAAPAAPATLEVKEKPAKPLPAKPVKKTAEPKAQPTRRSAMLGTLRAMFLTWFGAAWTSFTAGCVAAISAGVRFMYPNVLQEPPSVFKIGAPDKFDDGVIYEEWKNKYGVWIGKKNGELYAIRTVCTHLGCTPNWLAAEQKFKCPCHGSGFRMTGENFEGPAPRPLERYYIAIADDGQVMIDKSKKFQKELGQWTEDNGAFLHV